MMEASALASSGGTMSGAAAGGSGDGDGDASRLVPLLVLCRHLLVTICVARLFLFS